jgi:hypothetical protein
MGGAGQSALAGSRVLMPDILLIQPPIRDFYITPKRTLPYGLASIAAVLRRAGFSVGICDGLASAKSRIMPWPGPMEYLVPYFGRPDRSPFGLFHHFRHFGYSIEHLAKQAKDSGAFLIGISSLFSAYADTALETAVAVKKACPRVPIVFGGHHPTALPETVIHHPAVDFILRGEGEVGLPALAKALRSKSSLDKVPGLVRRTDDGTLCVAPPAVADDLGALPIPAFDLISWRHYQRSGRGSLSLTATRGCPMRCTYCAVNAASYHGFRQRSVESVVAEIDGAIDLHPMGFINFEDEHLCADKQWVLSLMEVMRSRFAARRLEIRAMNGLYAPSLDDDVLASMRAAGFKTLNLALISTVASQLKRFARPDTAGHLDRVLHTASRLGLNCVAYIIVAGPEQDPILCVDDLVYLARRRVLAGVSVFYPAPGSADYRWCQRTGLLPPDPALMRATALPLVHATNRTQAATLLRLGRIVNFMKSLVDHGETIPLPATAPSRIDPATDRIALGKRLLAAFLNDGVIYGIDASGSLYPHKCDKKLARHFIRQCRKISVKGTTG